MLCYVAGPGAPTGPEDEMLELMGRAGAVIALDDEPLIEPAMALMSCGPAFMALVAEASPRRAPRTASIPTTPCAWSSRPWAGTADYLAAARLRRSRACAPAWPRRAASTEQGLITLEERGLRDVCRAAVDAVVEATR